MVAAVVGVVASAPVAGVVAAGVGGGVARGFEIAPGTVAPDRGDVGGVSPLVNPGRDGTAPRAWQSASRPSSGVVFTLGAR